jgi:hypothetical protein
MVMIVLDFEMVIDGNHYYIHDDVAAVVVDDNHCY